MEEEKKGIKVYYYCKNIGGFVKPLELDVIMKIHDSLMGYHDRGKRGNYYWKAINELQISIAELIKEHKKIYVTPNDIKIISIEKLACG